MNSPQGLPGLHHRLHRPGESLVLFLHLGEQPDAVFQCPGVHGQLHPRFRGRGGLFLPLLHPQGMTGNDVAHSLGLFLGILQGAAVGLGFLTGCLQLLCGSSTVTLRSFLSLLHLGAFRCQRSSLRPAVRSGSHGHGLLGPQGFRLLLRTAGLFGGLLGLGEQLLQLRIQLCQLPIQFRNPGLLLLSLADQAACPAVCLLQLQLGPGNVLLIVGDGTLQHGNGGFLLLDLPVQSGRLTAAALRLHILALHLLAKLLTLGIQGVQS